MPGNIAVQGLLRDVRFTPKSGHVQYTSRCLLWANSGHRAVLSAGLICSLGG
jgi:hypothetical protein